MPNHIEYDPGVPTFKHSDKFEARAMVKMMQKEATLAERAWEERTSQRDNNKVFFNHLTRDEAVLDLKVRMDTYEPEQTDFTYSQTGEKIGTGLLASYHADLGGKNVMMTELRRNERLKRKTEKLIAKAVEKKTGNTQNIASWPPPQFPDAEKVLANEQKVEETIPEEVKEAKVEFKKKKVPPGLARRLAAKRKAAGLPELEVAKPEPNINVEKAEAAAKAALGEMGGFNIPGMDVETLKKLMAGEKIEKKAQSKPSQPPGLKPGETPAKTTGQNFINMPSEVPLSIPGLPAGWKFGDQMPSGFVPEAEEAPKQNVALEIAQSTQRKRRRPDQPVVFQADAMGALVDPSRFNTQIEQENLTPKQPGFYIQKRKEEQARRDAHEDKMRATSAKVIQSGPSNTSTDQYTANDFQRSYAAGHVRNNRMYGTYDAEAIDVSKHRNKYNRYKGGGVGGGGYR